MYYTEDENQISIEEFALPFGGMLNGSNRWVKLAGIMPWKHIEEIYAATMSQNTGRRAYSARIAFGALYIKQQERLSDEDVVTAIQENPYMQYFLGQKEFMTEPLFDSSMMVHFRKRFPVEEIAKINEYICTGKWPESIRNVDRNDGVEPETADNADDDGDDSDNDHRPPASSGSQKGKKNRNTSKKKEKRHKKNRGKLVMDATVAPADIKYPTDIDLLNQSREHLETAIDYLWEKVPHNGHKLPYSPKKARKSYLKLAKSKKWTKAKCRAAIGEQLRCVELASARLSRLQEEYPEWQGLLPAWLRQRLGVIPDVYAQQKDMYDRNSNVCPDRICSLSQPHVRPIKRGKRPNPTEFGQKLHLSVVNGYTFFEQTSWNNFNEALDLPAAVRDYKRKFGCWPEAVLADKIYQTRANKLFCKENGIRLSGLPLGRRRASETDAKVRKQMYDDSCERNIVESRNGIAKRRYGLDLIMSKLDETAKTEAALSILAMNAIHRIARWLALCRSMIVIFPVFQ